MPRGTLLILVGPSGCGKGTVLKEFLRQEENTFLSVSATTRAPRPGEEDGVHYFFLSREAFEALIAQNGLLEYASYCGNYYGTPKQPVEDRLAAGENVILEIEVQGAKAARAVYPEAVVVFILPPSLKELENRLTGRQTETAETIHRRLETAKKELLFARECDYVIVNDQVEQAAGALRAVLRAQPCTRERMSGQIEEILRECI